MFSGRTPGWRIRAHATRTHSFTRLRRHVFHKVCTGAYHMVNAETCFQTNHHCLHSMPARTKTPRQFAHHANFFVSCLNECLSFLHCNPRQGHAHESDHSELWFPRCHTHTKLGIGQRKSTCYSRFSFIVWYIRRHVERPLVP